MKNITISLPDDVVIDEIKFSQPNDSCQSGDGEQKLIAKIHWSGGGHYYSLKSSRWAIDSQNDKLNKFLDIICKLNDESFN